MGLLVGGVMEVGLLVGGVKLYLDKCIVHEQKSIFSTPLCIYMATIYSKI